MPAFGCSRAGVWLPPTREVKSTQACGDNRSTVRDFVIVAHEAPTDAGFSLDDLAGTGRMDLLSRCVTAGLLTSHGIRDARVHLVIRNTLTIRIDGTTARGIHPDERSTAAQIRDALAAKDGAIGRQPARPSPGVELYRMGLPDTLEMLDTDKRTIVRLDENGTAITEIQPPSNPVFVLSDHEELTDAETTILDEGCTRRYRLGPVPIHADHAIAVAHNWLDTEGFDRY